MVVFLASMLTGIANEKFIFKDEISEPKKEAILISEDEDNKLLYGSTRSNRYDTQVPPDDGLDSIYSKFSDSLSPDEKKSFKELFQEARYYPTWHEPSGGYVAPNPENIT